MPGSETDLDAAPSVIVREVYGYLPDDTNMDFQRADEILAEAAQHLAQMKTQIGLEIVDGMLH